MATHNTPAIPANAIKLELTPPPSDSFALPPDAGGSADGALGLGDGDVTLGVLALA